MRRSWHTYVYSVPVNQSQKWPAWNSHVWRHPWPPCWATRKGLGWMANWLLEWDFRLWVRPWRWQRHPQRPHWHCRFPRLSSQRLGLDHLGQIKTSNGILKEYHHWFELQSNTIWFPLCFLLGRRNASIDNQPRGLPWQPLDWVHLPKANFWWRSFRTLHDARTRPSAWQSNAQWRCWKWRQIPFLWWARHVGMLGFLNANNSLSFSLEAETSLTGAKNWRRIEGTAAAMATRKSSHVGSDGLPIRAFKI